MRSTAAAAAATALSMTDGKQLILTVPAHIVVVVVVVVIPRNVQYITVAYSLLGNYYQTISTWLTTPSQPGCVCVDAAAAVEAAEIDEKLIEFCRLKLIRWIALCCSFVVSR